MKHLALKQTVLSFCGILLLAGIIFPPPQTSAQEEVTTAIRRYKDREASTGYYEEYEVKPRHERPFDRDVFQTAI